MSDAFRRERPIAKVDAPRRIVYGVVLEPDSEDLQGDVLTVAEVEKAAHLFMGSQLVNEMHADLDPVGRVLESYIAPADFWLGEQLVKRGSWVMAVRLDEETFAKVQGGEYTGYSIEGVGRREPIG